MPKIKKTLVEVGEDLAIWWDSWPRETQMLILSLLAALPGGEWLQDRWGIEPAPIGWNEADIIGRLLTALKTREDVRYIIARIIRRRYP